MKTYDYRLVVKEGTNKGRVVTRSNNRERILKAWDHDNFDRFGNRYIDHRSEIEILWNDGEYREV